MKSDNVIARRKFPIGVQSFEDIRREDAIYVDKTAFVYRLVSEGKYYFLARPRRFGKSLFISTLEAYFKGRRELFEGLAIDSLESAWQVHAVLRFDFSRSRIVGAQSIGNLIDNLLAGHEEVYGRDERIAKEEYGLRLWSIIRKAREKTGQKVVLLVDEYDAPLLDSMHDKSLFCDIRQQLRNFYSPIKESSPDLAFVFITGITRYSQLSIFSELNNFMTISLDDEYAAICGFTKDEVEAQLAPEIERFASSLGISIPTALNRLKAYYDGYHFSENSPDIYNPLDLLQCLYKNKLSNYWYSTGTPTHLTEMMAQYSLRPEDLEGFIASEMDFNGPLETAETPIAVLYQSGYVTMKSARNGKYRLGFPNEEVRVSFLKGLMPYYSKLPMRENASFVVSLTNALEEHDVDRAMALMRSFIGSIPYNAERQDENHYKTIFYLVFRIASEFCVRTEACTSSGRIDTLIETDDSIYLFEFKLDGSAEEALKQIDEKGYAIQYEAGAKRVVKIGVNFDKDLRTIDRWIVAGDQARESGA